MQSDQSRRRFIKDGLIFTAGTALAVMDPMAALAARPARKVVVWSEGTAPKNVYPNDVNTAIAEGLRSMKNWEVVTANLNEPDQGLSQELLESAGVLVWWGHQKHGDVKDELVDRIVKRVTEGGMGFLPTHSGHWSKPFKALMKDSGSWDGGYVEDGSKLDLIVADPSHPIAKGIKDFVVPHTERYSEPFHVPKPDDLVFNGKYTKPDGSTEMSKQGLTWTVGKGHVFYFQPGHESYPIYFQEEIRQVFRNGVRWLRSAK